MTDTPKPLTVAQLIAQLQALPDQDMQVQVEGCDCYQQAKQVTTKTGEGYYDSGPYVLIESYDYGELGQ